MSSLEMKGGLLELISSINDVELLQKLHKTILEIIKKEEEQSEGDWWDDLSKEQQVELEAAIKASENPENLISHEEALKTMKKWRK